MRTNLTMKVSQGLVSMSLLTVPVLAAAELKAPAAKEVKTADAKTLLQDSDRYRGAAQEGIIWDVTVTSLEDGQEKKVSYVVRVKGNDALAEAKEPARYKGETMLFNDRTIWFFKPGIKKPVAISARQKLMGQAANGDIASTNYYRDYDGTIVGEETVDGHATYKLDLKAKEKNVTYDKIRYWIAKDSHLGIKAEFLTVSGDLFKSAVFEYKNSMTENGKTYPFVSKMTITDAVQTKNVTILDYSKARREDLAPSLFNVNNLVR